MTARGAILTPYVRGSARQETGPGGLRLWWKRVLPVGTINYKGRVLKFDRGYNDQLAETFNARAYDQVPLQLADSANTHTNDPERFRGDVVAMRSTGDGLWIGVSPTRRGEQVLLDNPQLGVSARIVEGYDRADGKFFPAAIQHVLATLDPRIPQLGGWQLIEAANEPAVTIDLTGEEFTGGTEGAGDMPELTQEQQNKLARLLNLPEEQFSALVSGSAASSMVPELTDEEILALTEDGEDISDDELAALIAGMSDEELAQVEAEWAGETQALSGATGLSSEAVMALEMANYRADENAAQIAALTRKADKDSFELERRRLIADLGLPPSVVEMARPLLQGAGHVVELAGDNGQPALVDAGLVMRRVLNEVGKMTSMLGIGIELGSTMDGPEDTGAAQERRSNVVALYKAQTGLK